MKRLYFIAGIVSAASFASFAALPHSGSTSGSMATQSDVSEIREKRHADLAFDSDLKRLAAVQGRYHENLPVRMNKPGHKVSHAKVAPVKAKAKARL